MLRLSNGYQFTVACASGALGYGKGWWWERYGLIPLGVLRPERYTVITKTLTYKPVEGNYVWWHPFTCTLPLSDGGVVNAFGLTNPGLPYWKQHYYNTDEAYRNVIVSIMPGTEEEAGRMAALLEHCREVHGIELNLSCPNVDQHYDVAKAVRITRTVRENTSHPVGVKLGYCNQFLETSLALAGTGVEWIDLINTIPYHAIFPRRRSPLRVFGLEGGYSGPKLRWYARDALRRVHATGLKTALVSGGGVGDGPEGVLRLRMGAAAVTVGTPFLLRPWRVDGIARYITDTEAWEGEVGCSTTDRRTTRVRQ